MKTKILLLAALMLGGYLFTSCQKDNGFIEETAMVKDTRLVVQNNSGEMEAPISNYPDPFLRYTTINYKIDSPGWVTIFVYSEKYEGDPDPGLATILVDEFQQAGIKSIRFDSNGFPPGQYYAEMRHANTCYRDLMTKKSIIQVEEKDK